MLWDRNLLESIHWRGSSKWLRFEEISLRYSTQSYTLVNSTYDDASAQKNECFEQWLAWEVPDQQAQKNIYDSNTYTTLIHPLFTKYYMGRV